MDIVVIVKSSVKKKNEYGYRYIINHVQKDLVHVHIALVLGNKIIL